MDRSWQQLENLVRTSRAPRDGDAFDVIIVGAGLSGLTAAYELRDHNPLVLEREPGVGGRVLTRTQAGVTYDLGAVFAFDSTGIPFQIEGANLFVEPSRVALWAGGELYEGADVLDCCSRMGWNATEWSALARFASERESGAGNLPPRVYETLNAFFQVVHPGELREYDPGFQRTALRAFSPFHYTGGNQIITSEFARRGELVPNAGPGPRLQLGAVVEQIVDEGERARVTFRQGDAPCTVTAQSVIVTAPAPVARQIVSPLDAETRGALDSVQYAPGVVVALCVRGLVLKELGCIVTPDAPTSTILFQHTLEPETAMLLVYFAGKKATQVGESDDAAIAQCALETAKRIPMADWTRAEIVFTDVQRWAHVGPVMDSAAARAWQHRNLALTSRVILGGELAARSDSQTLPFGMRAAVEGGRRAADEVKRILAGQKRSGRFAAHYLVDATLYHFAPDRPQFVERRSEGNIAFYGFILQASGDESLRDYLLSVARDNLWEYQTGFGATAEDSALVLEGLLEFGVAPDRLRASVAALVKQYYNADSGAFETVHGGRAAYWRGPSIDASAQIGCLLARIDPERYALEIRACAAFTSSQQQANGLWQGRWFPSKMTTTYHAIRQLGRAGYEDAVQRAYDAIFKSQLPTGSWADSVIETSAAVLALKLEPAPDFALLRAVERGRAWLVSRGRNEAWPGEPILYYWYEQPDGSRLFYHCADKGEGTSAWARLALRE